MPNIFKESLNELVTTEWPPVDTGTQGGCKFIAIELPNQPTGLEIWGIEFGIASPGGALASIGGVFAHIFIDLPKIDQAVANIGALFGGLANLPMHPTLNVKTRFFRRYGRWRNSAPFDVVDRFDVSPIKIPRGSSCTIVMSLWADAALAFTVHPYLCVRGGEKMATIRGPVPAGW